MIVILLSSLVSGSVGIVNPNGPTVVNDFTNCINKIIEVNFDQAGLLYFVNTMNMSTSVTRIRADILKSVHRDRDQINVQIVSPTRLDKPMCMGEALTTEDKLGTAGRFENIPLANYVVIIIDTYEDFTHAASRLVRSRTWNPKALFIVIFFHFAASDMNIKYAEYIVQCMFRRSVVNIVVIVPQAGNLRNAVVYGWRPYDPPRYCGYRNETSRDRLLVENICERGVVRHKNRNIFYNKVPHDMKGCQFDILALERQPFVSKSAKDPNIETQFIASLVRDFNFKPRYMLLDKLRGEKVQGEWAGALRDLIAMQGQVLLGGIFPDDEVHKDFECSNTYLADSYTWVVPRALQYPPWAAPMIIFSDLVWYSSVAGFSICVISWRVLGQLSGDTPRHRNMGHCFMNTLVSNLGFVAYNRPVKASLRVFFLFFSLYCILFVTGYQTKLIDLLTTPPFLHQLQTVEELVDSGLKFGGYEELHDLFYNSSDPFDNMIGEQWVDIDSVYEALIDVTVHRNFSLLCSRLELEHVSASIKELSDAFGNNKYYAFEENVFTVPLEMVALRGFPFMQQFSKRLLMYRQIGFGDRLRSFFTDQMLWRRAELLHDYDDDTGSDALSLEHLEGGFFALLIGYISGTIVFLIEIFVNSNFVTDRVERFKRFMKAKCHKHWVRKIK